MLSNKNHTIATKKSESNRNEILLSRLKLKNEIEGIPGMPNGPLVKPIQLFIMEEIIT